MAKAHETPPAEQNTPRPPTQDELRELTDYLCDLGPDRETASGQVDCAYVTVFDHYITDSPGYAGKVMTVVWGGSPSFFDLFYWDRDRMVRSDRDYDERECSQCGRKNGTLCWQCWRSTQ